MAWIESHTILVRHRKVVELAKELRIRRSYVIGHLHSLWHAALEQAEDGDLSQWSDELIAEYSDYPGDAPQLVQLLQKHGFLDGRLIHDWIEYAGRYLESKYRTSNPKKLQAIFNKHKSKSRVKKKSDFSQTKGSPPNLTLPNLTKPHIQTNKKLFGEFQNVLLTEEQYAKLKNLFGEFGTKKRIEDLSSGIASKGYKYKDHYATILTWERKNNTDYKATAYRPPDKPQADTSHRCRCGTIIPNGPAYWSCPKCGEEYGGALPKLAIKPMPAPPNTNTQKVEALRKLIKTV